MQTPSFVRSVGVSASLHQILDAILLKGLVVDLAPRLSLGGIEILSVGARVVIASVDTFLQHAEQIDKIGRPHHPDGIGASIPTPRRTGTKKRYCRRSSKPSATLLRKRPRKLKAGDPHRQWRQRPDSVLPTE